MEQFIVWRLQDDIPRYNTYIQECIDTTPYHLTEYLLAEAQAEEGVTKVFLYEENGEFALLPEIQRKVNALPYMYTKGASHNSCPCGMVGLSPMKHSLKEDVYDMITPHEYGGIVSNSFEIKLKQKLLTYILSYCNQNNIIFQFIRINPYLQKLPPVYQKSGYEVIHSNAQVYVDLTQTEEQIIVNYKSNVRRNIKRAEKEKLKCEIIHGSQKDMIVFQNMYQRSMEILEAKKFLYFNDKYFSKIAECDCSRVSFVRDNTDKIIAAGILLLCNDTVYYHLGCFDREFSLKRPMNYLMHSMILWSRRNGYKIFHLGGGSKSLLQFKEGYSNTRIDYYIAYQICDALKYEAVCEHWRKQFPQYGEEKYYPLYRYNE